MNRYRLLPLLFLLEGCIQSYPIPHPFVDQIVVDGMITNDAGPYTVRIFKSANPGDVRSEELNMIKGATVAISDDVGNREVLGEIDNGIYQTSPAGIRGEVGRKYSVDIKIGEKEFFSEPQELLPAGQIDSLFYVFREDEYESNELWEPRHAIDIFVNSRGEENSSHQYRWRWTSTHELKTFPELRIQMRPRECPQMYQDCPPIIIPIPFECSGYAKPYTPSGSGKLGPRGIVYLRPCVCCTCYLEEQGSVALLSQNRIVDGNEFNFTHIARFPVDKQRFNIKFYIKVDQLSISETLYDYWNLVKAQQTSEGSLFVANSVRVRGNIKSKTDPDEVVLGYFGVSGIRSKTLWISPRELPLVLQVDSIFAPCKNKYVKATYDKPLFW